LQSGETHVELKVLHDHRWSVSALARELGLSRNTVYRELSSPGPRRYAERERPADLCALLAVVPKACRPYRAKTKGKVERMVRELKESFLPWLSGQVLPAHPSLTDSDALARRWVEQVVLERRHRTTKRVVGAAWDDERPCLRPIPARILARLDRPGAVSLVENVMDLRQRGAGEHVEVRDLAEYEVVAG
jgi:transposase